VTAPASAPHEYHHPGRRDHLVIDHYPDGDPTCGVVFVRDIGDKTGQTHPEAVSDLEAW
jgi:hypothetical protein